MRFLKCNGCGYTWQYHGTGRGRTTCPECFKTVYFTTGTVDPETYRTNAVLQLQKWYLEEKHRVDQVADQALKESASATATE